MTSSVHANSDERFARQLLTEYLSKQAKCEFKCELNADEPPDLVVTWDDGIQWGVEVTRTYQQVLGSDGTNATSSEGRMELLRRIGEELEASTQETRKQNYALFLGPRPRDILSDQPVVLDKDWRKKSEENIRRHIEDDRTDILECPGVRLEPGGPGRRWKVYPNPGLAEIESATLVMLERALAKKVGDLPTWNGNFAQRWLLLLNFYPLVDDVGEVEGTLKRLTRSKPSLSGFDGVFWSGCGDRALVRIPLCESVSQPDWI